MNENEGDFHLPIPDFPEKLFPPFYLNSTVYWTVFTEWNFLKNGLPGFHWTQKQITWFLLDRKKINTIITIKTFPKFFRKIIWNSKCLTRLDSSRFVDFRTVRIFKIRQPRQILEPKTSENWLSEKNIYCARKFADEISFVHRHCSFHHG